MPEENEKTVEIKSEDLQKQLADLQKQKDDYLAGWQRARADFLNYKKEEIERVKGFIDYATEEMILKILPWLDNFYLAEKNLPEALKNDEYVKGLLQIKTQFESFLKEQGINQIEALGQKFDPEFHEVVGELEDQTRESGTVIEETQKGYLINGQLLRPTKVIINK
jgi:molecular chaperone GrpE